MPELERERPTQQNRFRFQPRWSTALGVLVWIGVLAFGSSIGTADVLTVALDGSGDHLSIQEAIDASTEGDVIRIADGIYYEELTVSGKALSLEAAKGSTGVVVDGFIKNPDTGNPDIRRCLNIVDVPAPGVQISGITFRNGFTSGEGSGIRMSGSVVTLDGCTVSNNFTDAGIGCAWCQGRRCRGGGISILGSSDAVIRNCSISGNRVRISFFSYGANGQSRGGGLYLEDSSVLVEESIIAGNEAIARDYPPNCANCNHPSSAVGAGICVATGGTLQMNDSQVIDGLIYGENASYGFGAGIACMGGTAIMNGCLLRGNESIIPNNCYCGPELNRGGAAYVDEGGSIQIIDCEIALNVVANASANEGGAVYIAKGSAASIQDSTVCANTQPVMYGAWNDLGGNALTEICCQAEDEADADEDGTCDIADECPLDPGKVVPGVCGCGVPDVDSDQDGTLDCNDLCPMDPTRVEPTPCGCGASASADLNGDLTVGAADLAIMLAFWGDYENFPLADLDFDGIIDGRDLSYLLFHWGPCD